MSELVKVDPAKLAQLFALTGEVAQKETQIEDNQKKLRHLHLDMHGLPLSNDIPESEFTSDQIFNRLCRAVEREIVAARVSKNGRREETVATQQAVKSVLDTCNSFHFDTDGVRHIGYFCREHPADLTAAPFPVLPFEAVALVNQHQAYVLFDAQIREHLADTDAWVDGGLWRSKYIAFQQEPKGWLLALGAVYLHAPDVVTMGRSISCDHTWVGIAQTADGDAESSGPIYTITPDDMPYQERIRGMIQQMLSMALDHCRYIDLPKHHLVIEEPRAWKPRQNPPKIPRAADRPRVRIVAPEEIRHIYPHLPAETGRTVTPHARRGFTKTLKSPKFKNKVGQRIVVRPTWVGPGEWEDKQIRYKVVTRS